MLVGDVIFVMRCDDVSGETQVTDYMRILGMPYVMMHVMDTLANSVTWIGRDHYFIDDSASIVLVLYQERDRPVVFGC